MKFSISFALLVAATGALASYVPVKRDDLPQLYNGQNISFAYSDIIVSGSNLFGLACEPFGQDIPDSLAATDGVGASEWDATTFPFFNPGTAYTVTMFEYDINTLQVVRKNLKSQSFIWVNRPGHDD
ncbi:hypothetical protein C8J56DRAFT_956491 [Mycena floridula]|nr:hypothetical protein C8J56DRAFT_967788 [Mycena floridula]KAJ7583083.1 hypothetical protein C8J56DRAFT_956491 [Mycena floridula]